MTSTEPTHPEVPPVTLGAVFADLRDLHDEVQALRHVRRDDTELAASRSARLAVIEQMVPQATPTTPSWPYRYQQLADWVDEVFARLAAGHRARWCSSWADHAEAQIRLEVLWHTWEAAMAAAPDTDPQWAAVDEWLRVRLDHHVDKLLGVDGPFAGCIPARGADPGRCSAPPRLAQRPLALAHDVAVARLDAAARLQAHRRGARRQPAGART